MQKNPNSELAKALTNSAKRRLRQKKMEQASGKQLRARKFATYLAKKLEGPTEGLQTRPFSVEVKQFQCDVRAAITHMTSNKAIGSDRIHVEMLKANPDAAAKLLTRMWQLVGKTGKVPEDWLRGVVVPLYTGKGPQQEPANSRPLCILSHVRKLVEKAVVTEIDRRFTTDRAQYGFQAGIQVSQAALSVLAAIQKDIEFVVVLDLAKAYENILKLLMESKLRNKVEDNLTKQLLIFLLTVHAQVSGDVTNTTIAMLRGLTQGGTSSPALFRLFINELLEKVRAELRETGLLLEGTDPIRLVADDVIGLVHSPEGLQVLLNACARWKKDNGLQWNPTKSQVLCIRQELVYQLLRAELEGVQLEFKDVVEYLGLRLTRTGFKGTDPIELT